MFRFKEEYYPHKELLRSDKFFRIIGTVKLPDGAKAPAGGIWVRIRGLRYFIPEGETETWYIMRVYYKNLDPKMDTITVDLKTDSSAYVPRCYYAQNGTTSKAEQATGIPVHKGDLTGIDFTLLKKE